VHTVHVGGWVILGIGILAGQLSGVHSRGHDDDDSKSDRTRCRAGELTDRQKLLDQDYFCGEEMYV